MTRLWCWLVGCVFERGPIDIHWRCRRCGRRAG